MKAAEETSQPRGLLSPREMVAAASRKIGRHVPFRPRMLTLDAPIVAFTFDDFPASAFENAASVLDDNGMLGTFYAATGLLGRHENGQLIASSEMIVDLARRGHEIGGHTHDHIDVQRASRQTLAENLQRNDKAIAKLVGRVEPFSFAYPFGVIAAPAKLFMMRRYPGLRGIQPGINRGLIDLAHLASQELYDSSSDSASIRAMLDNLERRPGWLIFYTHDVRPDPTDIGCSPAYFAEVVAEVRRRNIRVEPVIKTLHRIGEA